MQSEPIAQGVNQGADRLLGASILTTDAAHQAAALFARELIHRLSNSTSHRWIEFTECANGLMAWGTRNFDVRRHCVGPKRLRVFRADRLEIARVALLAVGPHRKIIIDNPIYRPFHVGQGGK